MVGAVVEGHLDVDHRVAGEDAVLHLFLNAFVDRRDVLLGNGSAGDGVLELVSAAGLAGLEAKINVTELPSTTALAHESAFLLDALADGLAVGDLRLADVGLDLELALEPIDDDLQMQLAHAGDDGLTGLLVGADAE